MSFQRAQRTQRKLRMALSGTTGSGKTWTALSLMAVLAKKLAVIDTERSSASLYAGRICEFDTCELATFSPDDYIAALSDAAKAGYDGVVIDSLSHAWMGKGGLLDQADAKGGRFDAWKTLTPQQHRMVDAILTYPGHVIFTMRAKTDYAVSKDDRGKTSIERLGLAPVQKEGIEYEADVVGMMDQDNTLQIIKTRFEGLPASIRKPGKDFAELLRTKLDVGGPAPVPKANGTEHEKLAETVERIGKAVKAYEACADRAALDALNAYTAKQPDYLKNATSVVDAMQTAERRVTMLDPVAS